MKQPFRLPGSFGRSTQGAALIFIHFSQVGSRVFEGA